MMDLMGEVFRRAVLVAQSRWGMILLQFEELAQIDVMPPKTEA